MRKHWKWAAAALALVCMVGMLAGCGNDEATVRETADHIIQQINDQNSRLIDDPDTIFRFESQNQLRDYMFYDYSCSEYDAGNQQDYETTVSVIFVEETGEFVGVRVITELCVNSSYTLTKYALHDVEEFGLADYDYQTYLDQTSVSGAIVGDWKTDISVKMPGETFKLIKMDYYNDLA